ncbi:uncharacterized protein LOC142335983 isoform X5 [Convolutriloba macropyga]|uniref:uncharacterized protein LOC142335983 isoform X5 n=1 Tax=Convolutriloba macropyga TaxID=536237 RepID=UPI003F5242DB
MNGQSASRRRRGGMDTDEDTPRSGDSGGSSALDDETEESLIAKRVERLASSLQDTGKNLRNVSGMLEEFKERDQDRGVAIDHLRRELQQSTDLLREERRRSIKERERGRNTGQTRGRSMSPRFARNGMTASSAHANVPFDHHQMRARPNRSVSPGAFGSRRAMAPPYRQYPASGYPLNLPTDLAGNGVAAHLDDLAPPSDRSAGEAETRQLLQELVENQRNLIQAHTQPQSKAVPQPNENDRISQLEKMLSQLQSDIRDSKVSGGKGGSDRRYDNPEISDNLRKELVNSHGTPQIRSPRAALSSNRGSNMSTGEHNKYSGSSPEDEREAMVEQSERNLKRKLIRSETAIAELEKQLDDAHRRLEGSEMARSEAQRQTVEMKEQLNRSEQDREHLRSRVNDYTQDIQREVSKREDSFASEKRQLEEEIRRLRSQLNDPRRNVEFENMKAEIEKLDKMKTNLSKRNDELQKKNQEKDIDATEFTYKMREVTNKLEDSDRVKKKAISRVDDLTRELNVLKIEREKMIEQLRNSETQLNQKAKDSEEIANKSKNIINALKAKIQKLTIDLDRATNSHQSHVDRINTLEREVEASRITATAAAAAKDHGPIPGAEHLSITDNAQLAAIHKEIHDVMVMRGEQEDLMRRKNEEIHDLRGELESLQRAHTSLKDDMDKLDEEITLNRKRLTEAEKIKDEQEDELIKLRTDGDVTRDELNRASAKAEELAIQVDQLQKRICEEVKEKDENKMALIQTEKKERLAREEISSLLIKLNEQEQMHHRIVNDLKRDIQDLVATEQKNVEEMVTSMKAEKSQLETEIANLRAEVSSEKESSRGMREDVAKLDRDLIEANEGLKKHAETELALTTKVEALQFEITIKDNLAQELESRIKKLERTLKAAKEKLRKEEQDMMSVMSMVSRGVNSLVDAAAGEGSLGRHKSAPMSTSTSDPNAWMAEIKAKMSWLQTEVSSWYSKEKDVHHQLKRTQQDILTLLNNSNQDKEFFLEQLEKQGSQIKHMASEKEDARLGNVDQESRLLTLHHNVEDLSNRLQMSSQLLEARLNMMHLHNSSASSAAGSGQSDAISLTSRSNCSSRLSPNPQLVTTTTTTLAVSSSHNKTSTISSHTNNTSISTCDTENKSVSSSIDNQLSSAKTSLSSVAAITKTVPSQFGPSLASKRQESLQHTSNSNNQNFAIPSGNLDTRGDLSSAKLKRIDSNEVNEANNNLSTKTVSFAVVEANAPSDNTPAHQEDQKSSFSIADSSIFYVPLSSLRPNYEHKSAQNLSSSNANIALEIQTGAAKSTRPQFSKTLPNLFSLEESDEDIGKVFDIDCVANIRPPQSVSSSYKPSSSSSLLSFITNKLSSQTSNNKEAERDEFEMTYKAQRSETMTNGDLYYQPTSRFVSSIARDSGPMAVYSATRVDTERTNGVATDSTVTPEQSVFHYNQPYSMDFSSVPYHLINTAVGTGVSQQTPIVYPQSSSTPAPNTNNGRLTHTPPTKHNSGTAFRTVGAQGAVDSVGTLTSFHHSASVPAAALNTKAPMSMTDEEFRAAFIPNTPPVEPSLLPMQAEKEFFTR